MRALRAQRAVNPTSKRQQALRQPKPKPQPKPELRGELVCKDVVVTLDDLHLADGKKMKLLGLLGKLCDLGADVRQEIAEATYMRHYIKTVIGAMNDFKETAAFTEPPPRSQEK